MAIELIETDRTHGTHGNKRAWLEEAVAATLTHGYRAVLSGEARGEFLANMARTGLGDYRSADTEAQDRVIITCIDTAVLFMA